MNQRLIQVASLAVIGAAALWSPPKVEARAEACAGQSVCVLGCPGNLTLFCLSVVGCDVGSPPYGVCEPGAGGCDIYWMDPEQDVGGVVQCGGAP